jgi:hypothetical protein
MVPKFENVQNCSLILVLNIVEKQLRDAAAAEVANVGSAQDDSAKSVVNRKRKSMDESEKAQDWYK